MYRPLFLTLPLTRHLPYPLRQSAVRDFHQTQDVERLKTKLGLVAGAEV